MSVCLPLYPLHNHIVQLTACHHTLQQMWLTAVTACNFTILRLGKFGKFENLECMVECLVVYSDIYPTRCNVTPFIYFWKLLNIFRVVSQPIIRSTYNCIYSIWHLSNRNCHLSLSWGYHPKHVEQFTEIKKVCVTVRLADYNLESNYTSNFPTKCTCTIEYFISFTKYLLHVSALAVPSSGRNLYHISKLSAC